jgi:hypothetical protein
MNIPLSDPLTWIVVLVAPVLIVALRGSFRRRHPPHGADHDDPSQG